MDNVAETKQFLTSRRAKITPQQVGLFGAGRRRVPGLRRSEVADLAGVSVEYYAQLERAGLGGASDSVLEALARALRLDEAERSHLWDLARAAAPAPRRRPVQRAPQAVRPSVVRLLELTGAVPMIVLNAQLDLLAANALGAALFSPVLATPTRPAGWPGGQPAAQVGVQVVGQVSGHSADLSVGDRSEHSVGHTAGFTAGPTARQVGRLVEGPPVNTARFTFLDDRARDFWVDWETAADDAVSQLRTEAGRHPHDPGLSGLVGELSTRSEEFRTRWAAHDVRLHLLGTKQLRHPVVGRVDLDFDVLELPADPGLSMISFTATAGSPHQDALELLAVHALSASTDQVTSA